MVTVGILILFYLHSCQMAFAVDGLGVMLSFTRSVHVLAVPLSEESRLCFVVTFASGERLRDFAHVSFE